MAFEYLMPDWLFLLIALGGLAVTGLAFWLRERKGDFENDKQPSGNEVMKDDQA